MGDPFSDIDVDDQGGENAVNREEPTPAEPSRLDDDGFLELDPTSTPEMIFQEPDDPSREDKKQNRYREEVEGRIRAEEKARLYEEELNRFRMAPQQPTPQPPVPQEDPVQRSLDENYTNRVRLFEAYQAKVSGGTLSPDEQDKYLKDSRALEEKQQELIAEKVLRKSGMGQQDPNAAMRQTIQSRYFDVVSNPQVRQWTIGRYHQRIAEGASSDPNSVIPLLDDIADEARQRFRIGKYRNGPAPTEATKARHTGPPAGGSPDSKDKPRGIKMTPELKKMANSLYSHIPDEKERYQKWANGPGKRLVEGGSK
jgi:hypothetical protein